MISGRKVMARGTGLILAFSVTVLTACATAAPGEPGEVGERPRDDADTRAASVAIVQASLQEGEEARALFENALQRGLAAIERDPTNPRAYLITGQAAVGTGDWVKADTMFTHAVELHPRFEDQVEAEREDGWATAYNLGAQALSEEEVEQALEYFRGADILYQERPEARLALGLLHAQLGDTDEAIGFYRGALEILDRGPPASIAEDEEQLEGWAQDRQIATFNLANLLAQADRFGDAADVLGEFLAQAAPTLEADVAMQALSAQATFLAQADRADEAEALYEELLARPDLGAMEYFQIGVGLFNASEYERAAEAFANSAKLNPYSRDAYLNLVQSLFSAAAELELEPASPQRDEQLRDLYSQLLEATDRVEEFDPLNRNLMRFTLRAYRTKMDLVPEAEAQRMAQHVQGLVRAYEEQEFEVNDITMNFEEEDRARVTGVFTNLNGTPGERVTIRFEVLDNRGNAIDTASTEVTVPQVEESVQFSFTVDPSRGEFSGWKYELVR